VGADCTILLSILPYFGSSFAGNASLDRCRLDTLRGLMLNFILMCTFLAVCSRVSRFNLTSLPAFCIVPGIAFIAHRSRVFLFYCIHTHAPIGNFELFPYPLACFSTSLLVFLPLSFHPRRFPIHVPTILKHESCVYLVILRKSQTRAPILLL
jgi:hypothetical protein